MRKVDRKHGRDCYPCHLHINLDERYRNRGIGSALIAAFARAGRERGMFRHPRGHGRAGAQCPFLCEERISSACDGALEPCRCGLHGPPVSAS